MKHTIGKTTSKLFDAFRLLEESYNQAYEAISDVYGEEQVDKLAQPLTEKIDEAKKELFGYVQTFTELSLAQTDSYNQDKTEVTL